MRITYVAPPQGVSVLLVKRTRAPRTAVADSILASRHDAPQTWLRQQFA